MWSMVVANLRVKKLVHLFFGKNLILNKFRSEERFMGEGKNSSMVEVGVGGGYLQGEKGRWGWCRG